MENISERRRRNRDELKHLDRQGWYLWGTSIVTMLALAAAVALLFLPALKWQLNRIELRRGPLAQLVVGLLVLVVLESAYLVVKQAEINGLRKFLVSMQSFARVYSADYPLDPLTGVYDRRALPEILAREREWVHRYQIPLCLVLVDIRAFAKLNQALGHLAGDKLLQELAKVLKGVGRQSDSILRYGSDQFLCLLPRTDLAGGKGFGRRVEETLRKSPSFANVEIQSGMGTYEAGDDPDRLLTDVEKGLEQAKSRSHNTGEHSAAEPLPESRTTRD